MIVVRRAGLVDSDAIAGVLLDSFVEYESLYSAQAFAATVLNTDKVRERLNEGPGWVAIVDNQIVGTVCAVARLRGLYIRGMGVGPQARGLRIGELLLSEIEKYARANRFERLFLSTTPFLHRAIRLYEKFGLRFCEDSADDLFGTPLLTMEKWLEVSSHR